MEQKIFPTGEIIFEEGDSGDTAFLVAAGLIEISQNRDGEKVVLGEISPGHMFGEMALISDKPRTATAIAKGEVICVVVPEVVFQSELDDSSALLKSLVLNLIGHIRSLMAQLEEARQNGEKEPEVVFHYPKSFKEYERDD